MKFQLDAAIGGGYRFLFSRIVSIIGTVWLPYAVLIGGCGLLAYLVLPHSVFQGDFSQLRLLMLFNPQLHAIRMVFTLSSYIVAAMVTVQLMRHSLGLKESTTFIYFSLSGPVWRMLVAFILGGLILVPAILVIALASAAAGVVTGMTGSHLQWWQTGAIIVALAVIAFLLIIYVAARLFFFLPAVVVAEEKIGIGRSWQLGKGNVGRIVLVWLCIAVPIWMVVGSVLGATVVPAVWAEVSHLPHNPTPAQIRPIIWSALRFAPVVLPVFIAAGIAVRGYMAGAIGTAYKAVTAPKEESV